MPRKVYTREWTLEEFQTLLERAGMTKSKLARALDIGPNAIAAWGRHNRVPGYAMAYLQLLVEYNRVRP